MSAINKLQHLSGPTQINDFDCGVFLCKFAHQIMQLRHTELTAIVDDFKNVKTREPIIDKCIVEHI